MSVCIRRNTGIQSTSSTMSMCIRESISDND